MTYYLSRQQVRKGVLLCIVFFLFSRCCYDVAPRPEQWIILGYFFESFSYMLLRIQKRDRIDAKIYYFFVNILYYRSATVLLKILESHITVS